MKIYIVMGRVAYEGDVAMLAFDSEKAATETARKYDKHKRASPVWDTPEREARESEWKSRAPDGWSLFDGYYVESVELVKVGQPY